MASLARKKSYENKSLVRPKEVVPYQAYMPSGPLSNPLPDSFSCIRLMNYQLVVCVHVIPSIRNPHLESEIGLWKGQDPTPDSNHPGLSHSGVSGAGSAAKFADPAVSPRKRGRQMAGAHSKTGRMDYITDNRRQVKQIQVGNKPPPPRGSGEK